jgi:hypothetical protein
VTVSFSVLYTRMTDTTSYEPTKDDDAENPTKIRHHDHDEGVLTMSKTIMWVGVHDDDRKSMAGTNNGHGACPTLCTISLMRICLSFYSARQTITTGCMYSAP